MGGFAGRRWSRAQSYFRLLLGTTFVLFGIAIARTGLVARWLGWVGALGGLLYMAIAIAVRYSGFEKPGGPVVQLLFVIFIVEILVDGLRGKADVAEAPG